MGSDRYDENTNAGFESGPKLIMAGRLDGFVDGRPVSFVANDGDLTLVVNNFGTLFTLKRSWPGARRGLLAFLKATNVRLRVRVKWFGEVEVFPRAHFLIRFVLPPV